MYELAKVRIAMVKESTIISDCQITTKRDIQRLIQEQLDYSDREIFGVINIDCRGVPLNWNTVSIGSLDSSIVSPREVFKTSILSNAYGIIAFHCHPSGDVTPSASDTDVTKRLHEAGNLLQIILVDHIIIGCGTSEIYSFRESSDIWN